MHKYPLIKPILILTITGIAILLLCLWGRSASDKSEPSAFYSFVHFLSGEKKTAPIKKSTYIEVTDGCGPHFEGTCVNVRSAPNTNSEVVGRLRNGMILKTSNKVTGEDGQKWYKIAFDDWLRYPERVAGDWYVAEDFVEDFVDIGDEEHDPKTSPPSDQKILVDRSEQMLYAYEGEKLFMETSISTGLELTPTPRGTFNIFKKTPSRYMQGPIPDISDQHYDLPGVPWNMYFTAQGAVIHGAYWHEKFGEPWSHGCVNLSPSEARKLYQWAEVGATVVVRD